MTFEVEQDDIVVSNSCPACAKNGHNLLSNCYTQEGLNFLSTSLCKKCGHIFRSKIPSETWFNSAFHKRHTEQIKTGYDPFNPEIERQRYDRYHAIGRLLQNHTDSNAKSLLDIGCGPGSGLDALNDIGFNVVGVESDQSRAQLALDKGHKIHLGEFDSFKSETNFDLIMLVHSLEHFQNPEKFLIKACQYAHKNTLFYIEVPEVLDHVKDWNDSLYLAHVSNFNDFSLMLLAARCGLKFLYKVNPYINTALHQGHLSMVFMLKPACSEVSIPEEQIEFALFDQIHERYYNGVTDADLLRPIEFVLKEINDISLSYKGIKELRKNVHENYANRQLNKIGDNRYYVE